MAPEPLGTAAMPSLLMLPAPSFGKQLRGLRLRGGLSQNQLALQAGVDPAYVNRLERAADTSTSMPSRKVILALWATIVQVCEEAGHPVDPIQRDELLTAAGHCPQAILDAGGWTAYSRRLRHEVLEGLTQTLRQLDIVLTGSQ